LWPLILKSPHEQSVSWIANMYPNLPPGVNQEGEPPRPPLKCGGESGSCFVDFLLMQQQT
jgi:hypothetical protein